MVVDIDDWERGFLSESLYWEFRSYGMKWLARPDSPLYTRLLEGSVPRAVGITVSNTFLQGVFGGHWIPHLRSVDEFSRRPRAEDCKIRSVWWSGSTTQGMPTLLQAWRLLKRPDAVLQLAVRSRTASTSPDSTGMLWRTTA